MYKSIVTFFFLVLHGCETLMLNIRERQRVDVTRIKFLGNICDVRRINRIIMRMFGAKLNLL